jgi:hypothetical protein
LEDLANKDAAEISNAAAKGLLAELPDDKNTNRGKSKDKKKKRDHIKAKDFEVLCITGFVICFFSLCRRCLVYIMHNSCVVGSWW